MKQALQNLVWNAEEKRARALWRLLGHGLALFTITIAVALVGRNLDLSDWLSARPLAFAGLRAGIVLAATLLCAHTLDRRGLQDFGLRLSPTWWADLAAGFGIGAIAMSAIFLVEWSLGWVVIEGQLEGAGPGAHFGWAWAGMVGTFAFVAFDEELFSRGYHLRNLAEGLNFARFGSTRGPVLAKVAAVLISAAFFGLLHAGNPAASWLSTLNIGVAGCMLAMGLLWTDELALPIGLHLSWNLFQGNVFGFPVSGTDAGPRFLSLRQGGEVWLTGGDFGPEAGLVGIAGMLLAIFLQFMWVRLAGREPMRLGPAASRV